MSGDQLTFDTGVVRGSLKKDGAGRGLAPVTFLHPETSIDSGNGLLVPYRFLTRERRYGFGSWEWPHTGRVRENGDAQLEWLAAPDRPFAFSTVYHWSSADTLDLTLFFCPQTNLHHFELFLGSYFRDFTVAKAYAKMGGAGHPGFVEARPEDGAMQLFPANTEVLSIITDGRWKYPPYPMDWSMRGGLEAPLGYKKDPKTGVTALIMAPASDCFAVSMAQEEAKLGSFYLSFFGVDAKPGDTLVGHARLVFGKDITEGQAMARYGDYVKQMKEVADETLMTETERTSLQTRSAAAVQKALAERADWFSAQAPPAGTNGWRTVFDGGRVYGRANNADVASGKVSVNQGVLRIDSTTLPLNFSGSDVALRVRVKKVSGQNCGLTLRGGPGHSYTAWFNGGDSFGIGMFSDGHWKNLISARTENKHDDFFEMEFRAEGGTLSVRCNYEEVCRVEDATLRNGTVSVGTFRGASLFKSIEVQTLTP
ncbi:MAG TPA: hypothetical protein VHB20_15175 [Verrucomicrobiae bacterium]|nr:hypothetical protein [Verrucomicrobiae bacterium]